jgi:mRNA-degrading endonuclease toxin of MazEF toxin-antitoxin module
MLDQALLFVPGVLSLSLLFMAGVLGLALLTLPIRTRLLIVHDSCLTSASALAESKLATIMRKVGRHRPPHHEDPIPHPSAANLDSIERVSVGTLTQRLGRLSDERMRQVCEALGVAVDCG